MLDEQLALIRNVQELLAEIELDSADGQVKLMVSIDSVSETVSESRLPADADGHGPATPVGRPSHIGNASFQIASDSPPYTKKSPAARFVRVGDFWEVALDAPARTVQHTKGMEYIHRLLALPGTRIHVWTLCYGTEPPPEAIETLIDDQALRKLDEAVRTKEAELEQSTDHGQREDLEQEIAELREFLGSTTMKRGTARRPRRSRSEREKVRERVGKAIRTALAHIKKVAPETHDHLEKWITDRSGMTPIYSCPKLELPAWVLREDQLPGSAGEA